MRFKFASTSKGRFNKVISSAYYHPLGNYGNMMDESTAPSNTPPCNAVYDGCNYYYLPWSGDKPCVCVESYWEKIAFRLEPLNALIRIIERLVNISFHTLFFSLKALLLLLLLYYH